MLSTCANVVIIGVADVAYERVVFFNYNRNVPIMKSEYEEDAACPPVKFHCFKIFKDGRETLVDDERKQTRLRSYQKSLFDIVYNGRT